MNPRTVLLCSSYYRPDSGGVETYVEALARSLSGEHGIRVIVVCSTADPAMVGRSVEDGVEVHRLPISFRILHTPVGLRWWRQVREIIDSTRPDVINVHAPVVGLTDVVGWAAGDIPVVLTYHTGHMTKPNPAWSALIQPYERIALPQLVGRAAEVIVSSGWVADQMLAPLGHRSTVISPGHDPAIFSPLDGDAAPQSARTQHVPAERDQAHRFLSVGAIDSTSRYKALDNLLTAFADLRRTEPNIHLDVVGTGNLLGFYRDEVRRLGITDSVTFWGALHGEALVERYRAATLVHPSRFDSFPTVLVEALACGRPVISTTVGGIGELITDGVHGRLVPPDDIPALTAAMAEVVRHPERAAAWARAGRQRVSTERTWAAVTRQTLTVFRRAVSGHSPATVAVVAAHYAPRIGGVERYAGHVVSALRDDPALRPVVITSRDPGQRRVEVVNGVEVRRLRPLLRISNTPVSPIWPAQLRFLLAATGARVVTAHSPVTFMPDVALAVRGRRPGMLTFHSGSMLKGPDGPGSVADLVKRPLDGLIAAYEKHLLPALFTRCDVVARSSQTALGPVDSPVLSPGVDLARFEPAGVDHQSGPPHGPPGTAELLFVGRVERSSRWKGLQVLIAALPAILAEIPQARVRVVGSGDAISGMQAQAAGLGVEHAIEFSGGLAPDEVPAAYRRASALVLPSLTSAESFGMVVAEAMASGCPVVASRVGGIPHLVTDEVTGLLVTPGDVDELAQACVRMLADGGLRSRLAAAATRHARESFAWDSTVTAYRQICRRLIEAPAGAGVSSIVAGAPE
ncbi:MAG: glycosyltransferase family 4 protein [Actinomycetales bacterium]